MKIVITVLGIILLLVCFVGGVLLHDKIKNAYYRENIGKVYVGMSEEELRSLMGEPKCRTFSDIGPEEYWSYGVDSFNDSPDYCGIILIRVSAEPRQVRNVNQ